jgi:hypothetical protein
MAIGDETTGFEYIIGNGGPDPVAALLATNIHTLQLESGDSVLSNDDDTDIEYYFNGVSITVASDTGLTGYSVGARYYVDTEDVDDDGDPTFERTYPNFNLTNATFTLSVQGAPTDRNPFFTSTKAESLFVPVDGVYGGQAGALSGYATAGIIDASKYVYTKVFNLAEFDFIPRLSPANQAIVRPSNGVFPNTPNDPANNIYPINTVTKFAPDPRRQVLITYSYSFTYAIGSGTTATTGITIEQFVSQPIEDYGPTIKALLADSYYGRGFYGLDQWPVEEPALYDADGTAIAPIPRIDVRVIDTSTSSGFAEYDQNTNGAGFPLKLDLEPEAVPEIPEDEIDDEDFGFEIPGVDYSTLIYGSTDIIDPSKFF